MTAMPAWERLLCCEHDRLPPAVQALLLAPPLHSAPVQAAGRGFRLQQPEAWTAPAPQALVPKLAIKSWRETGGLGVVYEGVPVLAIAAPLLQAPTAAQRLVARVWQHAGAVLRLHLSPYVALADVTEARYLVRAEGVRLSSACLRGRSAPLFRPAAARLQALAAEVARQLPPAPWIVDLALLPDDSLRLVEVNPALGPRELAELQRL